MDKGERQVLQPLPRIQTFWQTVVCPTKTLFLSLLIKSPIVKVYFTEVELKCEQSVGYYLSDSFDFSNLYQYLITVNVVGLNVSVAIRPHSLGLHNKLSEINVHVI